MKKNYYDILEVSPRARPEVIKASYRALMQINHPDKGKTARAAKVLNEAYSVLSKPKLREKYDKDRNKITGKVIGEYEILEMIAEGGFGKTYKARHVDLGTFVCIKHASRISPQDEEILLGEARSVWDMRHYAIPSMRSILRLDDGSLALVMSYIPGPTLDEILEKNRKLDAEHVCWITERILNALMYLHYNGVIHGDIKPQNIIIQPDRHMLVLVDYGLAMSKPSVDSESKGFTPYFAPPEQISGLTLLPESDFYSLGMTMMYALGGDIEKKEVPSSVPDLVCDFIKKLIRYDVLSRPRWDDENLIETLQDIRKKVFGRSSSFGLNIPKY